jgi:uncharacterized membrane protein AbrB (regulator of aidB expression)
LSEKQFWHVLESSTAAAPALEGSAPGGVSDMVSLGAQGQRSAFSQRPQQVRT